MNMHELKISLREKLAALGQKLDRKEQQMQPAKPRPQESWKSQQEWNTQKKGYEWLFAHIDKDTDGQISTDEYHAFQKFKAEQKDWQITLRENK